MTNIITVTLAESVLDNRFVSINSEGEAILANSSNPAMGFCIVGGDTDDIVQVFTSGRIPAPIEGLSGKPVYLAENSTAITTTSSQQVGYLADGGTMILDISAKQAQGGGITTAATFFKI